LRILLQQFRHGRFESIELAGAVSTTGGWGWGVEVFGEGVPADVEMTCDSALRPLLHQVQAVDFVDLFGAEHDQPLYKRGGNKRP
jgi:hypothetical protein